MKALLPDLIVSIIRSNLQDGNECSRDEFLCLFRCKVRIDKLVLFIDIRTTLPEACTKKTLSFLKVSTEAKQNPSATVFNMAKEPKVPL